METYWEPRIAGCPRNAWESLFTLEDMESLSEFLAVLGHPTQVAIPEWPLQSWG